MMRRPPRSTLSPYTSPFRAIIKAIACIKIDKQPLLISLKNRPTHENGEYSMLIDINGEGLADRVFDSNPKTDQQGLFVYLNTGDGFDNGKQWQANLGDNWKNLPRLACHCLPLSKPSPVLR
jgi:hypothetical protein